MGNCLSTPGDSVVRVEPARSVLTPAEQMLAESNANVTAALAAVNAANKAVNAANEAANAANETAKASAAASAAASARLQAQIDSLVQHLAGSGQPRLHTVLAQLQSPVQPPAPPPLVSTSGGAAASNVSGTVAPPLLPLRSTGGVGGGGDGDGKRATLLFTSPAHLPCAPEEVLVRDGGAASRSASQKKHEYPLHRLDCRLREPARSVLTPAEQQMLAEFNANCSARAPVIAVAVARAIAVALVWWITAAGCGRVVVPKSRSAPGDVRSRRRSQHSPRWRQRGGSSGGDGRIDSTGSSR